MKQKKKQEICCWSERFPFPLLYFKSAWSMVQKWRPILSSVVAFGTSLAVFGVSCAIMLSSPAPAMLAIAAASILHLDRSRGRDGPLSTCNGVAPPEQIQTLLANSCEESLCPGVNTTEGDPCFFFLLRRMEPLCSSASDGMSPSFSSRNRSHFT